MPYFCVKCRNEVVFEVKHGIRVGRDDRCPHCHGDLHCCKNCRHHDPAVHNQCRIPEADFIRDREAANFCAQFDFLERSAAPEQDDATARARAKLDALFRK